VELVEHMSPILMCALNAIRRRSGGTWPVLSDQMRKAWYARCGTVAGRSRARKSGTVCVNFDDNVHTS